MIHLQVKVQLTNMQFLRTSHSQLPFHSCGGRNKCQEEGVVCVRLAHGASPNTKNWPQFELSVYVVYLAVCIMVLSVCVVIGHADIM